MAEQYIQFSAAGQLLSAILHPGDAHIGVLLVVGGPQYRVGSHRQFVKLSRYLSANKVPSMRFDSRGMGDSSGEKLAFYQQDEDISQAIAAFFRHCPSLQQVILWGLCDAASAILIALNKPDPRIAAVVLLNPWVRQSQSHAKTLLRHYYLNRLRQKQFWQKLLSGGIAPLASLKQLWHTVKTSTAPKPISEASTEVTAHNYIDAMHQGWQAFSGNIMLISSADDLTAQEFLALCQQPKWQALLARCQHHSIANADHTFSCQAWRGQVEQLTLQFVQQQQHG